MGKVLKPLLLVAAVAVNFIPGVGQVVSAAILASTGVAVGAVAAASLTALALTTAASAIKTGRGALLSSSTLSRLSLSFSPDADRKIVFGETAMNTDVLYQEASGTDQEFIDIIVAVAAHRVDAITAIYSEDKLMWSAGGGVAGTYAGFLTVDIVTEGTRVNGIPINGGTIWNSDCTLTGCAYIKLRVKRTGATSKTSSPFAAGIPARLTVVGRGMPVYDPRRDSTAGGSGSHRANNQATWQYTDGSTPLGNNPALQALTFLLGWRVGGVLSVGAGVPASRLAMADWIAAANVCDELVPLFPSGNQRRYETHGVFGDADLPSTVVEVLCRHMNANLRDTGGRIGIRMAINDLGGGLVTFTNEDLQGGYDWQPCATLQDSYNVVRGKWTDPSVASLYQMPPYPAQSVTSPDSFNRPLVLDLPMVQDATRAQRIARQVLMRGQYKGVFSSNFGPRAWACEVGQPVRLTLPAIGATSKLFRVVSQELKVINSDGDAAAVCPMTLVEEDAAIYAWTGTDASAVVAAVAPVSYLPSSQPFLLGDLSDLNATEGAKLAGIAPGADVTAANTAANSNALGGTPATTVASNISTAATTAVWPNVTGTGRPADNADVTATALANDSLVIGTAAPIAVGALITAATTAATGAVPPKAITALGASAALDVVIPAGESRSFQTVVYFNLTSGTRTLTAPMEYRIGTGSWVGFGTADSAVDTGPSVLSVQNTGTVTNSGGTALNYQVRAVVAITGGTGGTVDADASYIGPF